MSNAKPIPGPWHWRIVHDHSSGKRIALILETRNAPMPLNDPVIFAVREDWMGELSPEREAAKRLIEDAPALLDLIQEAANTLAFWKPEQRTAYGFDDLYEKFNAALTKHGR